MAKTWSTYVKSTPILFDHPPPEKRPVTSLLFVGVKFDVSAYHVVPPPPTSLPIIYDGSLGWRVRMLELHLPPGPARFYVDPPFKLTNICRLKFDVSEK